MKDVFLKKWECAGDKVRLVYKDGTEVLVAATDFNRAFGCIVSAPKSDVVRDFSLPDGEKHINPQSVPRLVKPKHYLAIARKFKGHLKARTKRDIKALGFISDGDEEVDGVLCKRFIYDGTDDIKYQCRMTVHMDNQRVAVTNLEIPLYFRELHDSVPDYKLMEHLDRFFEACSETLDLEGYVGPVIEGCDILIPWSTDAELDEIEEDYPLKYRDIFSVKLGIGWIVYPSFDAKGNLWLFYLGYSQNADELSANVEREDGYYILGLQKLTKLEGEPLMVTLDVN